MADSSVSSLSVEAKAGSENFYRIMSLIVDTGTKILRLIFDAKVPPDQTLTEFFDSKSDKILKLQKAWILTPAQIGQIHCTDPSSENFDITLLVSLLRNVMPNVERPKKGWKTHPESSDKSLGADLIRIRDWRNRITAHCVKAQMATDDYEKLWDEVKEVLIRLSSTMGEEFEKQIRSETAEISTRTLTSFSNREKELIDIFQRWYSGSVNQKLESMEMSIAQFKEQHDGDRVDARLEREYMNESLQSLQQSVDDLQEEMIKAIHEAPIQKPVDEEQHQETRQGIQRVEDGIQSLTVEIQNVRQLVENRQPFDPDKLQELVEITIQAQLELGQQSFAQPVPESGGIAPSQFTPTRAPVTRAQGLQIKRATPTKGEGIRMSDKQIGEIAGYITKYWQMLAIHLGYEIQQTEVLDEMYPRKVTQRNLKLLKQWHDVVVEFGEDPRLLLASAFLNLQNREMALKVVDSRRLKEAENVRIGKDLEDAIKQISFDGDSSQDQKTSHNYSSKGPVHNIGAPDSVNIYGGHVTIPGIRINPSHKPQSSYSVPDISGLKLSDKTQGTFNYAGRGATNMFDANVNLTAPLVIGEQVTPAPAGQTVGYDEIDTGTGAPPSAEGERINKSPQGGELKKAQNDTLATDVMEVLVKYMKSVGVFVGGSKFGTAFRVGSKYAMTAWHVVRDCIDPLGSGIDDYSKLEASTVFINFGDDRSLPLQTVFHVCRTVPFIDKDLDIAVVEIKCLQGSILPPPLPLSEWDVSNCLSVKRLTFGGFGHPDSTKRTFDPGCEIVPKDSNRIIAAHAWLKQNDAYFERALKAQGKSRESLNWGYYGWNDDNKVMVNVYMEHGASGAPGFVCEDPSSIKVMAVLTRGLPVCFWDLPKIVQGSFPKDHQIELAAKMSHIHNSMQMQNAALRNDLFSVRN